MEPKTYIAFDEQGNQIGRRSVQQIKLHDYRHHARVVYIIAVHGDLTWDRKIQRTDDAQHEMTYVDGEVVYDAYQWRLKQAKGW